MKKIIICLLVLLFTVNFILAQSGGLHNSDTKNSGNMGYDLIDKSVIKKIDNFFKKIISDDISNGFEDLLINSPIVVKKIDLANLKKQTERAIEVYGKIEGYEFVNSQAITDSFIRLRYLGLHANYPMRWVFTFYRSPEKGWIVSDIKLDDQSDFFFSD
jgi:hypothetical protein